MEAHLQPFHSGGLEGGKLLNSCSEESAVISDLRKKPLHKKTQEPCALRRPPSPPCPMFLRRISKLWLNKYTYLKLKGNKLVGMDFQKYKYYRLSRNKLP
jgi:hypothetical protein